MLDMLLLNPTSSQQIARSILDGSVSVAISVRVCDVNETTLWALPYLTVGAKQGGAKFDTGTFLVDGQRTGFLNRIVNQAEERVIVLIGDNSRNVTAVVN